MKLGDSMAPVEACSVWNDLCPRKSRPPKIGDIPKHVAVDEESPGCSSSRSLGRSNEEKSRASMLERSTCCQTERGSSEISEALPVTEDFLKSTRPARIPEETSKIPDERILGSENSDNNVPIEKTFVAHSPVVKDICQNSSTEDRSKILKKNHSVRIAESVELRDDVASREYDTPDKIYVVRKDSALYIDESNIASPTHGDGLLGSSDPSGNIDEAGNSRLSKPRARRESSGYFSNLGTFDEDRWIACTMDLGDQQDVIATREISRERRRSSTKNRLPFACVQQQQVVQPNVGQRCGRQYAKNSSLVDPADRDVDVASAPPASDFATRASRGEMPNIAEQTSLELEKTASIEPRGDNETSASSVNEHLACETSKLSLKNVSTRKEADDDGRNVVGHSTDSTKKTLDATDGTSQWRTSGVQRRFMVAQQYSSPAVASTELERIIEKPRTERVNERTMDSLVSVEGIRRSRSIKIAIEDGDDDDEVVVANLEYQGRQASTLDSKRSLPKPIKVYQLLSTQSEDRGDDDARILDRRISLQITRQNEDETIGDSCKFSSRKQRKNCPSLTDEKKLVHADSVPILKIPSSSDLAPATPEYRGATSVKAGQSVTLKLLSTASGSSVCRDERSADADEPSSSSIAAGIRPIYPYCPYSPYASPQGSPRTNRRRPLRESRRVSIDSRQGALQLNQYKLLNNIGQGSYGIVKLAYNEEDDTHYAMKILSKKKLMKKAGIFGRIAPGRKGSTNPLAKVYREIALLKKLDHANVVKLVEVLDDPDEDNLYLVFELVERGEVLQLPTDKPLDEETARRYFRDVVMGVEYLHYQRIVHRDIKPSNLLVDSEGRVKVADLGVSAELRVAGELLSGSTGTPAFAAPETTTPGAQYSGTLCDVWSMGVTLYSLVTGKVPWDGAGSIVSVQAAIRAEPLRFPEKPRPSADLRDLLSRMLAKDPNRRANLAEIKEHRWLTKNGCEPLPDEMENCRLPVTVTDEEVARVVTRVPKLDTLILIKTMLKQHSFQNPFLPRRPAKSVAVAAANGSAKTLIESSNDSVTNGENLKSKTEQFHNAGRSNSAPDSYEWRTNGRQVSSDSLLPPVTEASNQETEIEKR